MSVFIGNHELAERKELISENLLIGTHDFSGGKWQKNTNVISVSLDSVQKDPNGNVPAIVNWPWNGLNQYLSFKKNDVVSIGAYIKLDNSIDNIIHAYCIDSNNQGSTLLSHTVDDTEYTDKSNTQFIVSNAKDLTASSWHWLTATFLISHDSASFMPRFEVEQSVNYEIGSMIVAKTSHLSCWRPNAKDYAFKSDLNALTKRIEALEKK